VERWCAGRGLRPGATLTLARMWELARRWYDDRFDLDWRRRSVAERQDILEAVGLTGPFWSLAPEPPAAADTRPTGAPAG
jgi:hypothetical protein